MDGHGLSTDVELCYGVMGKGGAFVLFDLFEPLDQDAMDDAKARGLYYCGALGVKGGVAEARVEPDADSAFTMVGAALEFARIVSAQLAPPSKGDEVAWLNSLYALGVPRA